MVRRGTFSLALGALCAAAALGPSADAGATVERRAASNVGLVIQPDRAIAGETVSMRTVVTPRVARRVVLQRLDGSRWVRQAVATTSSRGEHVFRQVGPRSTTTYRVRAPRSSAGSRTYAAASSPRRTLLVERQDAVLRLPRTASTGETVTAVVEVFPRRPGRPVALQRREGDIWTTVAVGAQSGNGIVSWDVVLDEPGESVHRAYVQPYDGADAVWSLAVRTTVGD